MRADGFLIVVMPYINLENALAQTTEEFGYMLALGRMSRMLAGKLHALWPEVEPMPLYPPFR
jgi:hypothetical protein